MLYTAALRTLFRSVYGEPVVVPWDEASSLVLVADGVGGFDLCGTALRHLAGTFPGPGATRVEVMDWGHGLWRWHADLTRVERHIEQGARMAVAVNAWRTRHPDRPVFLVGKSGGTGIVVRALEQLPENAVEAVVLLAPALSPRYDLSRALQATRREMVVFWSRLDVVILGAGTWLFGTIDRRRSLSAGLVGFRSPRSDSESYAKLKQICWRPTMAATGYLGGHIGPDLPAFLRKFVLPILTVPSQNAPTAKSSTSSESLVK